MQDSEFRLPELPPMPPKRMKVEPQIAVPNSFEEIIEELGSGRVPEDLAFWVSNGTALRSLPEFAAGLQSMSQECFDFHFNESKNDFANWIRDVLKKGQLAEQISRAASRSEMVELVRHELQKDSVRRLNFEKPPLTIWLRDDLEISSLHGLLNAAEMMSDSDFSDAVKRYDVDVCDWLKLIGEEQLSLTCYNASRKKLVKLLRERLDIAASPVQKVKKEKEVELIELPSQPKPSLPGLNAEVLRELKADVPHDTLDIPKLDIHSLEDHFMKSEVCEIAKSVADVQAPVQAVQIKPQPVPEKALSPPIPQLLLQKPEIMQELPAPADDLPAIQSMLANASTLVGMNSLAQARELVADISRRLYMVHADKLEKRRVQYDLLELETEIKLRALG